VPNTKEAMSVGAKEVQRALTKGRKQGGKRRRMNLKCHKRNDKG